YTHTYAHPRTRTHTLLPPRGPPRVLAAGEGGVASAQQGGYDAGRPNGDGAVRDRALSPGGAPVGGVFGHPTAVVRRRRGDDSIGGQGGACDEKELIRVGPMFGYYPEPNKSWVVCSLGSEANAKEAFEVEGLQVRHCRGDRYIRGFVGSAAMRDCWIEPKVEKWMAGVEALANIALQYPQSAYKGFADSLQAEWQYLCHCIPGAEAYLQWYYMPLRFKRLEAPADRGRHT
ncbi:hypothetical protein ACHAWF_009556, partial [Thalassiosira exigua]